MNSKIDIQRNGDKTPVRCAYCNEGFPVMTSVSVSMGDGDPNDLVADLDFVCKKCKTEYSVHIESSENGCMSRLGEFFICH